MAQTDLVDTVLAVAEKPIAAYLDNVLTQNKDTLIAEAKKLESSAIVAIGTTVLNTLAKDAPSPFWAVIAPHLAAAIEANEKTIIDALGGEDAAIFALLQHEVDAIV